MRTIDRSSWPQEMQDWRCPHEDLIHGVCGAGAAMWTHEVSATMLSAPSESGMQLLAQNIRPFDAVEKPVAYDVTVDCTEGHGVYVRTESVKP